MLDTIGAGATATTSIDWHDIWMKSQEAAELQEQIEQIHSNGRAQPKVATERRSEFATSWMHQAVALTKRNFQAYWRNPTYLIAKAVLNLAGGLLVGFTFFRSPDTIQGTQNKLFVRFFVACLQIMHSFNAGDFHGNDSLCSPIAATTINLHRRPLHLRSPRTSKQNVQLDRTRCITDSG